MNRRNFIKVIGTGAIIVAAPPLVIKGLSSKDEPRLRPVHDYQDIRKVLISYAMQCPNPHNKQPWKVSLDKDNVIRIFVDKQRLLPQTDPYHRQIHIGVGCFVDSLATVATHFNLQADIHYFPQGEYNNLRLEELPVADVILTNRESVVTNPLFAEMSRRQSTKTAYNPSPLHDTTFETISNLISDQNHYIDFISSDKDKREMGKFLIDAMTIEESNKLRSLETISMFRFNDEEFIQFRDGFGLEQNGTFGIKKWIAETMFISREKAERDPASFGQHSVDKVKEVVTHNPHYALLVTKDNSRLTQIKIGEIYNRINLVCSQLNVAMHPMSQILEEYDDMQSLQAEFKTYFQVNKTETVQMLFRLGKASTTPLTPRREVESVLF